MGALLVAGCGGGDPTGAGSAATADQGGAPLADEATSSLLLTKVVDGSEVALVTCGKRPAHVAVVLGTALTGVSG